MLAASDGSAPPNASRPPGAPPPLSPTLAAMPERHGFCPATAFDIFSHDADDFSHEKGKK